MITKNSIFILFYRRSFCTAVLTLITLSYCSGQKSTVTKSRGPFIDSVGFQSAKLRNAEIVSDLITNSHSLVSRALTKKPHSPDDTSSEDIFRSLEDSYQRYLHVFKPATTDSIFKVQSEYDLPATLRLSILDRQPFMNALLHTLSFHSMTTLDYTVEEHNKDTLRGSCILGNAPSQGLQWVHD